MVGPDQELAPLTPTLPLHCADLQERAETKRAARGHRDPAARGDGDNASLGLALGGSVLTIHSYIIAIASLFDFNSVSVYR